MAGQTGHRTAQEHARGSILVPAAMALCGLGAVGVLELLPAPTDRDVTVVFAPHISFDDAAARVNNAGASVLNVGFAGNVITARLGENSKSQTLRDVGAWLILSASPSELCTAGGWTRGQGTTTENS
ncbi:MAG: hypothetical protein P1U69_09590 [Parvibaculaceae bacterium]|nr:hypothetical protein [Parvibaculaceae bacterium]HBM87755.1 hypothetical protein [Rhodobiaceae bacterium]